MQYNINDSVRIIDEIKSIVSRTPDDWTNVNISKLQFYSNITDTLEASGISSNMYKSKFIYNYFSKPDIYGDIGHWIVHPGISPNKAAILSLSKSDDGLYGDCFSDWNDEKIINTREETMALLSLSNGLDPIYGKVDNGPFKDLVLISQRPWIYAISASNRTVYPKPEVITSHPLWPSMLAVFNIDMERNLSIWFSSLSEETLLMPIQEDRFDFYIDLFSKANTVEMGEERAIKVNEIFEEIIGEMITNSPVYKITEEDNFYKRNFNGIDRNSTIEKIISDHIQYVTTVSSDVLGKFLK